MKERTFKEGQAIAVEGQSGIGFFVIADGTATVSQGGQDRATLGPGDHFGEIALIDDGVRTASVTADWSEEDRNALARLLARLNDSIARATGCCDPIIAQPAS